MCYWHLTFQRMAEVVQLVGQSLKMYRVRHTFDPTSRKSEMLLRTIVTLMYRQGDVMSVHFKNPKGYLLTARSKTK